VRVGVLVRAVSRDPPEIDLDEPSLRNLPYVHTSGSVSLASHGLPEYPSFITDVRRSLK